MNCKFCTWFKSKNRNIPNHLNVRECTHHNWAGYISDPTKPPCGDAAWTQNNGLQIIYMPMHISIYGIDNPEAEPGFIYSKQKIHNAEFIFCRYWSKSDPHELRTKANSEATPIWRLVIKNTRPQELIQKAIEEIENE